MPIRYYASDAELRRLFNSVNGLIFPGGLVRLQLDLTCAAALRIVVPEPDACPQTWLWRHSPYVIAARKLYDMAIEANDAGDPFPVSLLAVADMQLRLCAQH